MTILLDPHIPFISGPLASVGAEIITDFTPEAISCADIIVCRTRALLNESTLAGSRVRLIATATIGTDHIDLGYCREHGIEVVNAPGCNAPAVAQWVLAAVRCVRGGFNGLTLGVVGVGNVGRIVERWGRSVGMNVLLCDPPRARREGGEGFSSLQRIAAEADVITFHTPLVKSGADATFHLADREFIDRCARRPLLLNAARGPVTDTQALLYGLENGLLSAVGIDCWEGEPDINLTLLNRAAIATPHIAGYSIEGKIRATQMVLNAVSRHLGLSQPLMADAPQPGPVPETITAGQILYDIAADTTALKSSPQHFEQLRNTYPLRHEPGQPVDN